ncbi:molecular chaperone TorD [Thaumasiovibrio subtropicus]|uniref:molecular chaperone TorD n=1 Tax=Thaumasiovibrio subtropicus TaxID=1891207 RepID=UPI001FE68ADA|nr:molecular chaperone TorD [Thaumasiovibrio subtropicus]
MINENRAQMYWWFSSLFFTELTEKQLQHYMSPQFLAFIQQLSEAEELQDASEHFSHALTRLNSREDVQLELAADFCSLFLTGDRASAIPYASVYLSQDKLTHGETAQEIRALLIEHQIGLDAQHNEPADHIAIILDFVGNLIINMNKHESDQQIARHLNDQIDIIQRYLVKWVPQFVDRVSQNDRFGFYATSAELLQAFLIYDLSYCIEQYQRHHTTP